MGVLQTTSLHCQKPHTSYKAIIRVPDDPLFQGATISTFDMATQPAKRAEFLRASVPRTTVHIRLVGWAAQVLVEGVQALEQPPTEVALVCLFLIVPGAFCSE